MRKSVTWVLVLFLGNWSSMSEARQAEILGFSGPAQRLDANEGSPFRSVILQQMEDKLRMPSRANMHGEAGHSSLGNSCEDYRYAPTYWLPAETERRRAAYFPIVIEVACEFDLPARLLDAVIAQESGYNPYALSTAGAMGMMQIMPGTARASGLRYPWDPVANIRAGARYLRDQKYRFGRMDLALAAYNAGPERRSLKSGFIPAIPETLNYVRTITTNWARLASLGQPNTDRIARITAATLAIRSSGYREVSLSVYNGISASNPI